jgi:hypothetical protein
MLVLKNDSIHKGKKAKRQTMIGKTLHRKLKIEHIRNYKLSVPKSYKNNEVSNTGSGEHLVIAYHWLFKYSVKVYFTEKELQSH